MDEMTTQTNVAPDAVHHAFSPSRLQQLKVCPGSYLMQQGLTEEPGPEAAEGTMLHERLATGNFDGLTTEQAELCAACLKFLAEVSGGEDSGAQVLHEQRLQICDENGNEISYGFADVVILHPDDRMSIIDWKFGRNPVAEVNRNLQLAAYALGAMQKFNKTACHCHVYQPRCYSASDYNFTKPAAILANIENVIAAATGGALILNPEPEACKYCLAKFKCPAFNSKFSALAVRPAFDLTDPDQLVKLYEQSKLVERFCREIEAAMKKYIDAHGSCGSWHYKEKPGNRECTDALRMFEVVSNLLTPAEFNACVTVSISRLVDSVVEKVQAAETAAGRKITKVAAKAQVEEMIRDVVQRGKAPRLLAQD